MDVEEYKVIRSPTIKSKRTFTEIDGEDIDNHDDNGFFANDEEQARHIQELRRDLISEMGRFISEIPNGSSSSSTNSNGVPNESSIFDTTKTDIRSNKYVKRAFALRALATSTGSVEDFIEVLNYPSRSPLTLRYKELAKNFNADAISVLRNKELIEKSYSKEYNRELNVYLSAIGNRKNDVYKVNELMFNLTAAYNQVSGVTSVN